MSNPEQGTATGPKRTGYSRRHETSEAHDAARAKYMAKPRQVAKQRRYTRLRARIALEPFLAKLAMLERHRYSLENAERPDKRALMELEKQRKELRAAMKPYEDIIAANR